MAVAPARSRGPWDAVSHGCSMAFPPRDLWSGATLYPSCTLRVRSKGSRMQRQATRPGVARRATLVPTEHPWGTCHPGPEPRWMPSGEFAPSSASTGTGGHRGAPRRGRRSGCMTLWLAPRQPPNDSHLGVGIHRHPAGEHAGPLARDAAHSPSGAVDKQGCLPADIPVQRCRSLGS